MKRPSGSSSLRPPAAMEKQRRDQMKNLYSKLASLLRLQSYERMPLLGLLEKATDSIKQWKQMVDQLTARKKELENELRGEMSNDINFHVVQVSEMDSYLEALYSRFGIDSSLIEYNLKQLVA
ncbi:Myc-type, basic helix-loop-helix domain-containing protein [Tanacetum coccineum]